MKYRRHKINPMYDLPIRYKNIMIRNYEIVHYLHIPGDLLNVRYTIIIFIGLNNNPQNIYFFIKVKELPVVTAYKCFTCFEDKRMI